MLVGAFVLVLGAAFVWGILWISAGGKPQNFDRYVVYMTESVSGLNVDAPLNYRGVDVGKVEDIGIDPGNPERIRLLLQVRQGTPISEATVATLEYQGLTGIANVNLSGGKADAAPLELAPGEEYPVIKGRPSIFARLDSTSEDLLTNLIEASANLNALLGESNRANVSRSIENVATLTERFAAQAGQLEAIINHLEATLENTRTASADFPQLVRQLSQTADAITRMADEIGGVGESLAATSRSVEHTVGASGKDLVDFTRTTLPEITAMVYELRLASENLHRMSEDMVRNPSVLMYGSAEPEPGPGE
jgi:phospholipid/cholesterol/gamma-HCH transport system substrate-binding protein